jgi:Tfp pilus assembly protein PilO
MKLTNREKVLVTILLLGIFIFVMYRYMITPTKLDIVELEVIKQEKELELSQIRNTINREEDFKAAFKLYNKELNEISNNYFVDLEQEDMLVLLNNLNKSENLAINNFAFTPGSEDLETREQMAVRFDYTGPYQEVYNFLEKINASDKYIQVSRLDIESSDNNVINGQIITNFNSIPMMASFASGDSIFDIHGTLVSRQLDSPYERYASLAEKYNVSDDEMSKMEIYMSRRKTNVINNFNSSETFTIGNDLDVVSTVNLSNKRLYGQHSYEFDYDFGIKKKFNQANLVFEDELVINNQHDFISMWVNAEEITGHEMGVVLIDSNGDDHELIFNSSLDFKGWEVLEVELPIEINYPCKVQRIFVRSTDYDQRLSGSVLIDQLQTADVKELD